MPSVSYKLPANAVNIHCHFMTFNHLPDQYTTNLLRKMTGLEISENFAERLFSLLPLPRVRRFINALKTENFWGHEGTVDNYLTYSEYVSRKYIPRRRENLHHYRFFVPIMMDMITASDITSGNGASYFTDDLANKDGVVPFFIQVHEYAYLAAKYPYRLFPFVMFNPLRKGSLKICQYAVDKLGFVGVKLYPAMGFNPDYESKDNKQHYINEQLKEFYAWASRTELPVMVHTQYASMQRISLTEEQAKAYTQLSHWETLLKKLQPFSFRLCFSHCGGIDFIKRRASQQKEFSLECRAGILKLMQAHNSDKKKRIYTDISAHNPKTLNRTEKAAYAEQLNAQLQTYPGTLMFGTDTPALSLDITDQEYTQRFLELIDKKYHKAFFAETALEYLFGRQFYLPPRYLGNLSNLHARGLLPKDPTARETIANLGFVRRENSRYQLLV